LSDENRVFATLAGFRAAAYGAQRLLGWLGLAILIGCAIAAGFGLLPAWSIAVAASPLGLSLLWGMLWRKRVEAAFWQSARVPRRGSAVRLPLEAMLLALGATLFSGAAASAGETSRLLNLGSGKELDLEALLETAGIGGWIALAMGGVALLVSLYLFFSLWGGNFAPRKLRAALLEKIAAGDIESARKLCSASSGLLARSVLAGLPPEGGQPSSSCDLPAARIEATGKRGAARWRALVDLLAAFGLLAPVAGLFGTVLGLINVFAGAARADASTALIAAGAVAALIPAATSLAVSLFALSVHYLADLRLGALVAKCEAACLECSAALSDLGTEVRGRSGLTTLSLQRESAETAG
jgi:biopolymer transport protein ExbB/TolQ